MALLDPPGRFPFHQIGQPLMPRYLWPLEQVFQPPRLVLGILILWLECSSFGPVVDAQLVLPPAIGPRQRLEKSIARSTAQPYRAAPRRIGGYARDHSELTI